ncbi:unnamed protein product [Boreogadus saida]
MDFTGNRGPLLKELTIEKMLAEVLVTVKELSRESMEDFNEVQTSLKSDVSVWQKMIARLASVGGTSSEAMIRRMLGSSVSNSLACDFNWAGKGTKQAFSQTIIQDCMFAAARQYDKKMSNLDFSNAVKRGVKRTHCLNKV